jgi:hypothetical protein
MRFRTFTDRLFMALGEVCTRVPDHLVGAEQVAETAGLDHYSGWIREAVNRLQLEGYLTTQNSLTQTSVMLTGAGWDHYHDLLEKNGVPEDSSGVTEVVPASDRVVRLDHNSADFRDADERLSEVIQAIRANNELAANDPEEHEQRIAELEGGQRLLKAVRVRVNAAMEMLIKPLQWLLVKVGENLISALITIAITALAALFGISL